MDKILTAKEILEKKGYNIKLKFNMEACIRAISEWFKENDAESRLILVPYPFARLAGEYPDGFTDVAEAANLFVNERMGKVVPMNSGGLPFFVDKNNIDDVVRILQDNYRFQVEKYKKGTYLVSLI